MSLSEIISELTTGKTLAVGGALVVLIMTLFEVSKIKINPWSHLARIIGRAINGEVIQHVNDLAKDVQQLRDDHAEERAVEQRRRIILFGDEILHGVKHSKEHFDQILTDITTYEIFCREHKDFKNDVATATIERIRSVYQECMRENSFL